MAERYPKHARVECCDPEHRDHQHSHVTGTVIDWHVTWTMGSADAEEYEIAWDGITHTQRHTASTVRRVYSEEEMRLMRDQLRTELQHLREEV